MSWAEVEALCGEKAAVVLQRQGLDRISEAARRRQTEESTLVTAGGAFRCRRMTFASEYPLFL
jgi:hypothetical protein